MIEIDAKNLSCPVPDLRVKKAIEYDGINELKVLLNSESFKLLLKIK